MWFVLCFLWFDSLPFHSVHSQIAYGRVHVNVAHSPPNGVALAAEQMLAQGETAVFWFIAQLHSASLKNIESS